MKRAVLLALGLTVFLGVVYVSLAADERRAPR